MVNFLLVPLYTYNFPDEEYGVVVDFYALTAFLMVIFGYRMETAFFRFGTEAKKRENAFSTALISIFTSTLIFAGILLLFSDFIAVNLLNYPLDFGLYVSIFALVLGFDVIAEIPFARLRLENRAWRFAAIKLINIGVNIGLNLFFIVFCPWVLAQGVDTVGYQFVEGVYNPEFGVGYIFLSNLLASTMTILLLLPEILRTRRQFDGSLWRRMFLYSSPLILAGLAGIANEVIDRQLLKYLLPEADALAQLGVYGACYKLAMLMSLFTQAFRYAAEPFFFSNKENKDAKILYADVGKYFAIVGIFAFLVINFYLDIFQYFVGEEYREGLVVVPILLIANLFLGMYYNLSVWYKLTDRTPWGGYIMAVGAVITVVLNVWWIPKIGYLGSAWATLICYATVTAISYYFGQKYYPVPYDLKRIFGYLAAAIGLYFISVFFAKQTEAVAFVCMAFNTGLLLLFCGLVYRAEKFVNHT